MTKRLALLLLLCVAFIVPAAGARGDTEPPVLEIQSPEMAEFDLNTGAISATNVLVKYGLTILTAHQASINTNTGDIFAEGDVRVQKEDQTWVGDRLRYNYLTSQLDGSEFRTGKTPFFAAGHDLHGNSDQHIYSATNALVTADDYYNPLFKIRAKRLKIVPGQYFEAWDAVLYAGKVPLFYFPYYKRDLGPNAGTFNVQPGYRGVFGPYILSRYDWLLNDNVAAAVHADYRERRGPGVGPDFKFHLGETDVGIVKYYYTHDQDPGIDQSTVTVPENRQRAYFSYDAVVRTNLTLKAQAAYWGDPLVTHDFFESEYRQDIQPKTYIELNQVTPNWSLDVLAQKRINDFYDTVERLPDVRLSGFRQQIGDTPFYYESQSSVGWYRRLFADTNFMQAPFSASRADTWHQITMPETLFGWLNVTPRVGGRFTWYSDAEGSGATTTEQGRSVLNTGAEVSTKLSRTWAGYENHFLDMDGARHILEPSIDYVYVPRPNIRPGELPQFDYELTNGLYLLPIEYPDYNAIDSIDSQNVIRWGLRNRIQTKRNGQLDDVVNWAVYTDWRLRPRTDLGTWSDIFSDLELHPRTWLRINSTLRFDIQAERFDLAQDTVTFQPNNRWSWTVGQFFLRAGPIFGQGEDLITSTFYYRLNENWGTRISHNFDATTGTMQEQYYTLYRDLRSWTAALTFRVLNNVGRAPDYTIAATFSLKARPKFGLGQDTVAPPTLVGY